MDKDPHEWCLRQSKRIKAIDPKMRNYKLLTQMPGELEHEMKCRCNQDCTIDDNANTLQDVRKRTNIGKYYPYKSISFKEKQTFRVEIKDKHKSRIAEVKMKKNSCHNSPEEESQTEDSESDFMGDAIREHSDYDQDPIEEFLVEYQEETQIESQDIQLEAGMPQDTAKKKLV
ncbi:hypothetical protein O181_035486 [Austropuccinia psidii MF-1]|uniref:Uncharacterized protein n=1 Tax=Austropuccinia psidii MF-1 TaxID=1389203 RepID=A0A9Q3D8D3_9BASI|nr:hypothetical protein [Austropuccinia psidii MF-1]